MNSTINKSDKSHIDLGKVYFLETKAELLKAFRLPSFAIPALVFPLMFYVFFGLIFNRHGMDGMMPGYLMATYGVFGIIGPALFSFGVGVAIEKDQGWFALKQVSPMPFSAYFVARVITAMVFASIIVLSLFILGLSFGGVSLDYVQWFMSFIILILGALPFCALGLWLGLTLKAQAAPALVNLIYLPLAFVSGLWIPIQWFPKVMQTAAELSPAFHLSQLVLKFQGLDLGMNTWYHLAVLLIYSVLFSFLAMRAFKKA